jgi:hypothetical protein
MWLPLHSKNDGFKGILLERGYSFAKELSLIHCAYGTPMCVNNCSCVFFRLPLDLDIEVKR